MGHRTLEFESRAQASILVCSSVINRIDAPMAAELIELMLQGWRSQPTLGPVHGPRTLLLRHWIEKCLFRIKWAINQDYSANSSRDMQFLLFLAIFSQNWPNSAKWRKSSLINMSFRKVHYKMSLKNLVPLIFSISHDSPPSQTRLYHQYFLISKKWKFCPVSHKKIVPSVTKEK